ncbi:hypothetical protein AAAC51_36485 [Priestia megaterium]
MNKFVRDTAGDTALMIVLRGHIYIEHELEEMLKIGLKEPGTIFKKDGNTRIGFETKLNWAVAIGMLPKDARTAYVNLNTLRNKYAHKLDADLTDEDLKGIKDGFNTDINETYKQFLESSIDEQRNSSTWKIRRMITVLWLHSKFAIYNYNQDKIDKYATEKKNIEWKIKAAEWILSEELNKEVRDKNKIKDMRKDLKAFQKGLNKIENNNLT